jgi:hypothetical protein
MVSSRRPAGHGFPFDRLQAATPGKLPSPSEGTRRGTLAPPPSQSRFVIDLSARCIQETWNGVGLSPVSVVSLCEQATPPTTPRVRGDNRMPSLGDLLSRASACASAWHPREAETRHLPPCPCLAPSTPPVTGRCWLHTFPMGKFEQGFLDEYGPAQVGLSPPFVRKATAPFGTQPTTPAVHATHGEINERYP